MDLHKLLPHLRNAVTIVEGAIDAEDRLVLAEKALKDAEQKSVDAKKLAEELAVTAQRKLDDAMAKAAQIIDQATKQGEREIETVRKQCSEMIEKTRDDLEKTSAKLKSDRVKLAELERKIEKAEKTDAQLQASIKEAKSKFSGLME